jgi:hypothetical protein
MDFAITAFAIGAAFAVGVIFGKYVISEAEAIKKHVTEAEARIRADVTAAVKTFTTRL